MEGFLDRFVKSEDISRMESKQETEGLLTREKLGITVVCISDTHGDHAALDLPNGHILIHGGDFTRFGKQSDAEDTNAWLGTQKEKFQAH